MKYVRNMGFWQTCSLSVKTITLIFTKNIYMNEKLFENESFVGEQQEHCFVHYFTNKKLRRRCIDILHGLLKFLQES